MPGVYNYLTTISWDIQVLFLPCLGTNQCRYMKEIAFRCEAGIIAIIYQIDMEMLITIDGILQSFPASLTVGGVTVTWTLREYIRVTIGLSSVLVYSSPVGLVTSAKIYTVDAVNSSGLIGNINGTWLDYSKCGTSISKSAALGDNDLWECLKKQFTPEKANRFISSKYKNESLGSGGYCLVLSNQTLTLPGLSGLLPHGTLELTFTYWIRLTSITTSVEISYSLVKLAFGMKFIELQVSSGMLQVIWGKTYSTDIHVTLDIWAYIVLSRSSDGSIVIYYITETGVQSDTIHPISHAGYITISGITIHSSTGLITEVDCIRTWGKAKMLSEAATDMNNYCGPSRNDPTLLMSVPLDEGRGDHVTMTTYRSDERTSIPSGRNTGTIKGQVTNDTWQASSIPVLNVYTPYTLTAQTTRGISNAYVRAAKDCLALLTTNTSGVNIHCKNMTSSLRDHYLEACIRDYDRVGKANATRILENSLLFYCQTALEVDECIFSGHMDFCIKVPQKPKFPVWVIITISGTIVLVFLFIFIGCYCKRRRRKKNVKDPGRSITLSGYEEETSFSWRASTVVSEGTKVTIPRPQIHTEGLDIYGGAVRDSRELEPDYDTSAVSDSDKDMTSYAHDSPSYTEQTGAASWMQHEIIVSKPATDLTTFRHQQPEDQASWIGKAQNIKIKRPVVSAGVIPDDDAIEDSETTYI